MIRLLAALLILLVAAPAIAIDEEAGRTLGALIALGRLEAAQALVDSLSASTPDDPVLIHLQGKIAAERWEFETARPLLETSAAADTAGTWLAAWSHLLLGTCAWNRGDAETARAEWTTARDLRATRHATRQAQLHLNCLFPHRTFADWTTVETEHYRIRISPRADVEDPDAFAARHEATLLWLAEWFDWTPDGPIRMYVWSGNEEAAGYGLPTLGFSRAQVSMIHAHPHQTVGHETAHVVSMRALRPRQVANLISEGTAIYHDGRRVDRLDRARAAWRDRSHDVPAPSIRELWNDWSLLPESIGYPVAGAFVEHLVERGGRERFLALFADQRLERAAELYGAEFATWVAEFESALND